MRATVVERRLKAAPSLDRLNPPRRPLSCVTLAMLRHLCAPLSEERMSEQRNERCSHIKEIFWLKKVKSFFFVCVKTKHKHISLCQCLCTSLIRHLTVQTQGCFSNQITLSNKAALFYYSNSLFDDRRPIVPFSQNLNLTIKVRVMSWRGDLDR